MTAITMRHAEIIQKLGEFYTLLAQLGSFEPSLVQIPSPDAPAPIRRTAALGAGYTEEVVNLMEQLPYISKGPNIWDPEIFGSTEPIDYTKCENENAFRTWREYDDGQDQEDEDGNPDLIPGSLVKLTEIHLYGITLLYDTQTCLLIPWQPFENPDDTIGYAHVPAKRPSEVLNPWIEGYRTFNFMHTPQGNLWDTERLRPDPPEHLGPKAQAKWWATRAVDEALFKLKDVYLECGWNMTSPVQHTFDRAKFIEMRKQYIDEVVLPLKRKEHEAWKAPHQPDEL
ncbi:hypothetical protein BD289DRAFT_456627 [Coniella lustricola]|uniref:Uncharacterized protein n=1 Tax=Coniella lustricola TaxID=2025994 RepID=A0A2T2ZV41_9PEZI|nr:hypothetical protein BD289DRAFT_456627 [Coniella lustricola]